MSADLYKALYESMRQQQMAQKFAASWRDMTAWQHKRGPN